VYCEDSINVRLNTGYESAALDDLTKITFDGTNINFVLSGGTESRAHTNVEIMEFTTTASDVSLPVELVSFSATQENNMVILSWETASEVENFGFEIERILSGSDTWKRLGFVEGNGSVTRTTNYTFSDKSLSKQSNVMYRLKQIDYDGSYEYSAAVSIVYNENLLPKRDKLYSNYPNPFNPLTSIRYEINAVILFLIFEPVQAQTVSNSYTVIQEVLIGNSGSYYVPITSAPSNAIITNDHLRAQLKSEGLSKPALFDTNGDDVEVIITKTNNKSVLGSMNELSYRLEYAVWDWEGAGNPDEVKMADYINDTPMTAIKETWPPRELKSILSKDNKNGI